MQLSADPLAVLRALDASLHGQVRPPTQAMRAALGVLSSACRAERVRLIGSPAVGLGFLELAAEQAPLMDGGEALAALLAECAQRSQGAEQGSLWQCAQGRVRACVAIAADDGRALAALGWQRSAAADEWPRDDLEFLSVVAALFVAPLSSLRVDEPRPEPDGAFAAGAPGQSAHAVEPWIARSPCSQQLRDALQRVAGSSARVLLSGETGAGKTFLARTLVAAARPQLHGELVEIDCGDPSGSNGPRAWLARATGGALLLERVSALPAELQAALASELQHGSAASSVRVIATTTIELLPAVRDGRFRQDLYYHLQAFPLHVPALRERAADLDALIAMGLRKARLRQPAVRGCELSAEARACLGVYAWPGNVRELENVIARAVVLTSGDRIELEALPSELRGPRRALAREPETLRERMRRFERRLIRDALREAAGRKAAAARALQVTPRVLAYRMQRLGLDPHSDD